MTDWRFGRLHICLPDVQCASANLGLGFHGEVMCSTGSIPVGRCVGDWRALFPSLDRGLFGEYDDADNGPPSIATRPGGTTISLQRSYWLQQKLVGGPVSRKCSTTSWQISFVSRFSRLCIECWILDLDDH